MSITTNLMEAVVSDSQREMDGKTLTRPALLVADGAGEVTYCVDVDIGQKRVDPNTGDEQLAILRNVAIASGDQSMLYADVGAAVRVRRSDSGRLEVVGFSKTMPGTYTRVAVTLGTPGPDPIEYSVADPADLTLTARLLSYDELADVGAGYGFVPYGAAGLFRGGVLVEVR